MDEALIQNAIKKLEFRDIVLHTSRLERDKDQEPILYPTSIRQTAEHEVVTDRLFFLDADEDEVEILRTYIRFLTSGFKVSADNGEETRTEASPLFSIEAEYRVDYLVLSELSDEEIGEFSRYNAVHNAWPFWRQHVYQMVSNAKLPRVTIPFFRRDSGAPKPKRTSRKKPTKKIAKG